MTASSFTAPSSLSCKKPDVFHLSLPDGPLTLEQDIRRLLITGLLILDEGDHHKDGEIDLAALGVPLVNGLPLAIKLHDDQFTPTPAMTAVVNQNVEDIARAYRIDSQYGGCSVSDVADYVTNVVIVDMVNAIREKSVASR